MIIDHYRLETLEEAVELLSRDHPPTYPLGGGSELNKPNKERYVVIDLPNLGPGFLEKKKIFLRIRATATPQ